MGRSSHIDAVIRFQLIIASGQRDAAAPHDRADQDLGLQHGGDVFQLQPRKRAVLLQLEFHQLQPPAGKNFTCEEAGVAEQPLDLQCGTALRIDDQGKTEHLPHLQHLRRVFRVADADDGMDGRVQLTGRDAAEQVDFVRVRDRDEQVRFRCACLRKGVQRSAVALKPHDVVKLAGRVKGLLFAVDQGDIVTVGGKDFCQGGSDFAGAGYNDLHNDLRKGTGIVK